MESNLLAENDQTYLELLNSLKFNEHPSKLVQESLKIFVNAMRSILQNYTCSLTFEELYNLLYNLYMEGCSSILYSILEKLIIFYINQNFTFLINNPSEDEFLTRIYEFLTKYHKSLNLIKDATLYLRVKYIKPSNCLSLETISNQYLSKSFLDNSKFKHRFKNQLRDVFEQYRCNTTLQLIVLKNISEMLFALDHTVYSSLIENSFIEYFQCLYRSIFISLLCEYKNLTNYIKKIIYHLNKVKKFCKDNLVARTGSLLNDLLIEMALESFSDIQKFDKNGLIDWIENKNFSDIEIFHDLFCKNSKAQLFFINYFGESMIAYIKILIKKDQILQSKDNYYELWLKSFDDFYEFCEKLINICFKNDKNITKAFSKYYQIYCENLSMLSFLLINLIHSYLSNVSDIISNNFLNKFCFLFPFLLDKNEFIKTYQYFLVKRIAYNKFQIVKENAVSNYLKNHIGTNYINIDRMLKDIKLSDHINDEFNIIPRNVIGVQAYYTPVRPFEIGYACHSVTHLHALKAKEMFSSESKRRSEEFHFSIKIFNSFDFNSFNPEMENYKTSGYFSDNLVQFEEYWKIKNKHKKLTLIPSLSTVEFSLITYPQTTNIMIRTKIPSITLLPAIYSLIFGKACERILIKNPHNNKIELNDEFRIDPNYNHEQETIIIDTIEPKLFPSIMSKSSNTVRIVEIIHVIKCHIVAKIKQCKSMPQEDLLDYILKNMSKYHVERSQILKAIDSLVDGSYIYPDSKRNLAYHCPDS
ncbi:hypothetical protein HZS_4238 [Henneguya salminicola]|nr:hypothetical protein HZS_4238 [Henneguya salminicola]